MKVSLLVLGAVVALFAAGCTAGMAGMGGCGMGGGGGGHGSHGRAPAPVEKANCPVCGTEVTITERTPRATYEGSLYYFVSEDHERRFLADPQQYLERTEERAPAPEPEAENETGHQH